MNRNHYLKPKTNWLTSLFFRNAEANIAIGIASFTASAPIVSIVILVEAMMSVSFQTMSRKIHYGCMNISR